MHENAPYAFIYPDFEALKRAHIINIEEEIRWYAVELYNMEVEESRKVRGYTVFINRLPKTKSGEFDISKLVEQIDIKEKPEVIREDEPNDELYEILTSYISTISQNRILFSSHLELDLGLDSLDYVELFIFVEKSFGVVIDEIIFSEIMTIKELYSYIKERYTHIDAVTVHWRDVLSEDINEKLIFSPYIMFLYKIVLLPLFKLYFRLEIIGKENIPSTTCIIAPTHQSMLDGFIMEASLPFGILKNTFFIAYKQVFGKNILKPISDNGQSILIDANEDLKHSIQYVALPLKEGKNLVIFPEGARTRDRKLLEFRPLFAILSSNLNVPIVPVIIDGSFEALATGKTFPRPKKIRVTFLKPIKHNGLSYNELSAKVKEAIEEEIKRNPFSF
jgi:long-chain acyl-CoA synthetase